jgi:hypothetical protein
MSIADHWKVGSRKERKKESVTEGKCVMPLLRLEQYSPIAAHFLSWPSHNETVVPSKQPFLKRPLEGFTWVVVVGVWGCLWCHKHLVLVLVFGISIYCESCC